MGSRGWSFCAGAQLPAAVAVIAVVARRRRGGRPWATSRAAPYDAFQNATAIACTM